MTKSKTRAITMKSNTNARKGDENGKQFTFRLYKKQIEKLEQWKLAGLNVSEIIRQLIDESPTERG